MNFNWSFFTDLGIIGLALLLSTLIRARVRFFQRFLIPNALTAGFLLLLYFNFLAPRFGMNNDSLGQLVYHLLSISFIAMTLRTRPAQERKGRMRIFATSMAVISQFAIQGFVGLMVTLAMMKWFMPQLFHSFGFLLPLGFAQGPGQAYAIGEGWARFGIEGAGSIGLTFAAVGFIFASFGGIFLINYGIRHEWLKPEFLKGLDTGSVRSGIYHSGRPRPSGSEVTTESEAIDPFTYHVSMVLVVYLGAYLFLRLLTYLLSMTGPLGEDLAVNLWGISFIFAALVGIAAKGLLRITKVDFTLDNKTLTRISGLAVDLMVAAAIGAISLVVVKAFLVPILIVALIAGSITFVTVPWFCSRIFFDHPFHRTMMIFGVSTGTLPTGLALLRVIDPEFATPVASDYMYASGLTFLFAIPFILAINLPVYTYTTGDMRYFWMAIAVCVGYALFVAIGFFIVAGKRVFAKASSVWLEDDES